MLMFKMQYHCGKYCFVTYLEDEVIIPDTLLSEIINSKLSLLSCALSEIKYILYYCTGNGIIDSLQVLLLHECFTKPYNEEQMVSILTRPVNLSSDLVLPDCDI